MATEKLEFLILANGRPAVKAIDKVDKKTDKLGKTAKKTGVTADAMLTKMRAGFLAVGAAMVIAVNKARTFERASLGLTQAQKDWAMETALATDIQAEQVAGFLKSAQTAGLAEKQMKELAKSAIALGYAYPHESAETLNDNLIMLASTGEAQGFVVDILEQSYAKLGISIEDLDLKSRSAAEKMRLVGEVVKKSQDQMNTSKFTDLNIALGRLSNAWVEFGNTVASTGVFKLLADGLTAVGNAADMSISKFKELGNVRDLAKANADMAITKELLKERIKLEEKIATITSDSWFASIRRKKAEKELGVVNAKLSKMQIKALAVIKKAQLEVKDAVVETVEAAKSFEELNTPFEEYIEGAKKAMAVTVKWKELGASAIGKLDSALGSVIDGTKKAKDAFKDMARSIIADLIKIAIRQAIIKGISMIFGGFHTGTTEVKHTGGTIAKASIPTYHTGVRSDERIAKLQVGEAVINRTGAARNPQAIDAMNRGMPVGGGDSTVVNVTYSPQVNALDPRTAQIVIAENAPTVVSIVRQAFNRTGQNINI